jgi:hypothetical protein
MRFPAVVFMAQMTFVHEGWTWERLGERRLPAPRDSQRRSDTSRASDSTVLPQRQIAISLMRASATIPQRRSSLCATLIALTA